MPLDGAGRRWCRPGGAEEAASIAAFVASGAVRKVEARTARGAYPGAAGRRSRATWHKGFKCQPETIRSGHRGAQEDRIIAALDNSRFVRRLPALLTRPQWFVWACRQCLSLTETAAALG